MINLEEIQITVEMLQLIAEVEEFRGTWKILKDLTPDRLVALKKVATIESIGSSTRIEGSKLTDAQIETLLARVDSHSFASRDEQEVAGYAYACDRICENYQALTLTENHIKQIHSWVLQYSEKDERHRGHYKIAPIRIEAFDPYGKSLGVIFETSSPMKTPLQMQKLIAWTQRAFQDKQLHPLLIIGLFTVLFLAIHPFQDGNGRLSRLLTTLLLLQTGYTYAPYSSLESVIEANKESYYLALQRSQRAWQKEKPDWTPWLSFFLQCLQRQKVHLQVKLDQETLLQESNSSLSKKVVELLKGHGRLSISDLVVLTSANRNTLKKTLGELVAQGKIILYGRGKGSRYGIW